MSDDGRRLRTLQTRAQLLVAAVAMLREGQKPSIEQVGQRAGVSRRNAHRYFASREHMLAEAALESVQDRIDGLVEGALTAPTARERVIALARTLTKTSFEYEVELKTIISLSFDPQHLEASGADRRLRSERRVEWTEAALSPIRSRLDDKTFRRLVAGIAVNIGIDAVSVLSDICRQTPAQVEEVCVTNVCNIFDAALSDGTSVSDLRLRKDVGRRD